MTSYRIALTLHVIAAIVLVGPTFGIPLVLRAGGISSVTLRVVASFDRLGNWGLAALAVTGVWMIAASEDLRDTFSDQKWLHFGIFLWLVMCVLAMGFATPKNKKALKLADANQNDEAAKVLKPMDVLGPILGILGLAIIFLMTYKPGF